MASLRKKKNGIWEIQFRDEYRRKKTITLSSTKYNERTARSLQSAVTVLIDKKINNDPTQHAPTKKWLEHAAQEIREKLARFGLCDLPSKHTAQELWDTFLDKNRDMYEETKKTYLHSKDRFFSFFKLTELLDELTQDRMKEWRRFLLEDRKFASATVAGTISKAKAVFNWAREQRWLAVSPLDGVGRGSFRNEAKDRFILESEYQRLIACCPCQDWRTIIALARKGGLHPCEILMLRWDKIKMDGDRFHVYNPKTKAWRFAPIFLDVRLELEKLLTLPETKDKEFVINRYTSRVGVNLVTQFNRIARQAGLGRVLRPFDNMRASRSVEIRKKFGPKAEAEWIGHSTKVAFEYYFMVLEDEFAVAAGRKTTAEMDISPDAL